MTLKGDFIESQLLGYIELTMQTIAFLVISILMVIYIKYFCIKNKNDNTKTMDTRFHLLLFGSLLSALIYIYCHYILHTILVLALGYKPNRFCLIANIIQILIFIQRLHVYVFFITRLYITFKGSVVEINKIKIKLIVALMFITLTVVGVYNTAVSWFVKEFFCMEDDLAYLLYVSLILMVLSDYFWSILLSVLYIKKLRELIKLINSNNDRKDVKLFNVINKLTILAVTTVVLSFIIVVIHVSISSWSSAMVPTELITNNICIMISFAVFKESYKNYCFCCIKVHNKCYGIHHETIELTKEIELNDSTKLSSDTTQLSLPSNTDKN